MQRFKKVLVFCFISGFPVLEGFSAYAQASAQASSNRAPLKACLDQAVHSPAKALATAAGFPVEDTDSAWLCRAYALLALERFHEAGLIFADLTDRTEEPAETARLTRQASAAFANARQEDSKDLAVLWAARRRAIEPDKIETLLLQADLASRAPDADFTKAIGFALTAQTLATPDQQPRVLAVTASIRMKSGAYEDARQDLFSALALNPGDPTALYVLGRWLLDQDQVLQAEQVWTRLSKSKEPKWQNLARQELLRFQN